MSFQDKTPEMKQAINTLTSHWFGKSTEQAMFDKTCTTCNSPITKFKDVLSEKEYSISGMCQECQDNVFG